MENQMQAKKIVDILCQQHNELLSFKKQVIAQISQRSKLTPFKRSILKRIFRRIQIGIGIDFAKPQLIQRILIRLIGKIHIQPYQVYYKMSRIAKKFQLDQNQLALWCIYLESLSRNDLSTNLNTTLRHTAYMAKTKLDKQWFDIDCIGKKFHQSHRYWLCLTSFREDVTDQEILIKYLDLLHDSKRAPLKRPYHQRLVDSLVQEYELKQQKVDLSSTQSGDFEENFRYEVLELDLFNVDTIMQLEAYYG